MQIDSHYHEGDRERWEHHSWRPLHLSGWVESLWYSEGILEASRERILPGGTVEVVLNLGDEMRVAEGQGSTRLVGGTLSGLLSRYAVLEHPRFHRALGMRLSPLGARAVLGPGFSSLHNYFALLDEVLGDEGREVVSRCAELASVPARFRLVAGWLAQKIRRADPLDPVIVWVAQQLEQSAGSVSIVALRERSGLSQGKFAASFREVLGLTPKQLARVFRFRRVLSLLSEESAGLPEAALSAGYYDQSHMNAEFRALAGLSPREYLASRYPGGITTAESP